METRSLLLIAHILFGAAVLARGIQVQSGMRSFSSAIKGGRVAANTEKVLYEYESQVPGVITEQWFTGESQSAVKMAMYEIR